MPRPTVIATADEAGLASTLVDAVLAARAADPLGPVYALVRSNLVRAQLGRRLRERAGGFANVHFLTFLDLVRVLAGPVRPLPPGAEPVIFGRLARDLPADGYFGRVREKPGWAEVFAAAAADVGEAGVDAWPADFDLGPKLRSFGRLYDGYRRLVREGGFADGSDLFARAAAAAPRFRDLLGADRLFVFGFYDFNELQRRLLAALAPAVELRVYIPYEEAPAFAFAAPTVRWWRELGAEFAPPAPARGAAPAGGPELVVVSAPDPEREAREAARLALALVRARGMRFGEMAVLYRGDESARVVAETFGALGVPFFLEAGVPLAATRAGDALRRLLELAAGRDGPRPYRRAEVMDLVAAAPWRDAAVEAARWDEVSAAAGVTGGRENWRQRLARFAASADAEGPSAAAAAARAALAFVEGLCDDLARFPAVSSWGEFAGVLASLAEKYFAADAEREAVLAAVADLGAYDQLGLAAPDFATFARAVNSRLADTAYRPREPRFEGEGINVLSVTRARGTSFRAVFLLGVNEGVYPARPAQDPVLLDDERREFNSRAAGRWAFNVRGEAVGEDPLVFRLALDAARDFVAVSYHRVDDGGQERLPSHYLLQLAADRLGEAVAADAFDRRLAAQPWFRRAGAAQPPAADEALDDAEYWLARAAADGPDAVKSYLAATDEACAAAAADAASRRAADLTPRDGLVTSAAGSRWLERRFGGPAVALAARDLEALAACPRQFFFGRVLALAPWEEPEEPFTLGGLDRGLLLHGVLRDVYRELAPYARPSPAEAVAVVTRCVAAAFERLAGVDAASLPFVLEMERRHMEARLAAFVGAEVAAWDDGPRPAYFELRFGGTPREGDDPRSADIPFSLALDAGRVAAVYGRMDRVDEGGGTVRVVDYKAGRPANYRNGTLAGGRQLQPALYLLACRALFGGGEGDAGYAFPLAEEQPAWRDVTGGRDAPSLARVVSELAAAWLALAREGAFVTGVVEENEGGACGWCPFAMLCGVTSRRLPRAKAGSPLVARVRALWEVD